MEEKDRGQTRLDEYVAQFPEDVQAILARLRAVIKEAAPEAEERISYNMPGYYLNGFLVSFAVWKCHIGFYPRTSGMETSIEELSAYPGTKGSVHFPLDQPIPYDLIQKIVKFRVQENQGNVNSG